MKDVKDDDKVEDEGVESNEKAGSIGHSHHCFPVHTGQLETSKGSDQACCSTDASQNVHPDDHCNWDCLDVGGEQRVLDVRKPDYEENAGKVERSVACMLQVVGMPDESLVGSVDVGLGGVLDCRQGEEVGEATDEEEPDAGQEKPGFVVEDHLVRTKGEGVGFGLDHV